MKSVAGFTLIEVVIVVAILGIIAAIVIPEFGQASQKAKEAAAKENLQTLRTAIERYAIEHNDIAPGYVGNKSSATITGLALKLALLDNGKYLRDFPSNPFNGLSNFNLIQNSAPMPTTPTGKYGWIYRAQTKIIRLDWPGTDSSGTLYYNY